VIAGIKDTLQESTIYFKTYEEREDAFRKRVFALIPRKYSGPKLFWRDFGRISLEELLKLIEQPVAYITSNPRDCLAFGTPGQVLTAARLCAQKVAENVVPGVAQVAEDFGLTENLLQPIRTLSGGETVKLALAKTFLYAAFSRRLTIASPFSWLSRDNSAYFKRLFDHYSDGGIPVELLALEGEDSTEPVKLIDVRDAESDRPVDFTVCLKNVVIPLGSSLNPLQDQNACAEVGNLEGDFLSPCLIVGENGQGKSLLAKVLTGTIASQGRAKIMCANRPGPARLLFQDVISQTLLRSFDAIAASTFRKFQAGAREVYAKIRKKYFAYLNGAADSSGEPGLAGSFGLDRRRQFRSLLEMKTILVAVRLCGQPRALILDEPDWGLTRQSAVALVLAVVKVSHQFGTPVLLISHKPWWLKIANSIIHVERSAKETGKNRNCLFQIKPAGGDPRRR
jgi:energy-coupling factor transporter ATP-binding protein EcfA2